MGPVKSTNRNTNAQTPRVSCINGSRSGWIPPVVVGFVTVISFLPILRNQFVEWDDYENLVNNASYRGLGWSQLRWMFTTFHMGPYQPLSWMTLGLDYLIWGMNPAGYHLASLLWHAANGILFYFVARRLLALVWSNSFDQAPWKLGASAAFAALIFAVHPLRVESVAWATERRDLVSGFFFLATIHCYLQASANGHAKRRPNWWLGAALGFYILSLLGKATAITLPVILLILDIYPLRRLSGEPRNWWNPAARAIWREKLLFALPAVVFAVIALWGQEQASALKPLRGYSIDSRIVQALFGASFYLWKTFLPVRLSPLYQIPPNFSFWQPAIFCGAVSTIIITVSLYLLRKRWPAGLACWAYSVVTAAPVLGLVSTGPQLVADRYSYLTCLSWAVLAGGGLLIVLRSDQTRIAIAALTGAAIAVIVFAVLTWEQISVWRDTGTLWSHVLKLDPKSSFAHYNLARFLARHGQREAAMEHYREALRIRPEDADTHNNLGLLLALNGQIAESLKEFEAALQSDPRYAKAFFNLGRVYALSGELDKAVENYQRALELNPNQAEIRLGLGNALARKGLLEAASAQLELAAKLDPASADARTAWGRVLEAQGKRIEAEGQYQEALRLLKAQRAVVAPNS